uniref:Kinesin-like protein n=1 Tax=Panagrolaimus superbus TaxID=310955 RepID=A0A914YQ57_9BILA
MVNQENINVVARIRPFSAWIGTNRQSCLLIDPDNSTITVKSPTKNQKFEVNTVFNEDTTQASIFAKVGRSIVDGFVEGINGTIFAYGQTGSGKTYTMIGPDALEPNVSTFSDENRGIIPRALEDIFATLNAEVKKKPDSFKFSMKCSFLELYNERLYDLLQDNDATIKIQSCLEQITVVGAAEFEVTTYEECMHHLWRGWDQRKVAETSMNRESSRSHAVFMLTLVTEHTEGTVINRRSSRLNLVDLAGSERQGLTNNTGVQLKEAGNINKSLSILARVIRTLASSKPAQYIPYRDSLLTFLLRDSLGGNAKTTVVVNIHPNSEFVGDTISTLTFAVNVQKVKNTARVNEAITCDDIKSWKEEIERLRQENRDLKAQLDGNNNPKFISSPADTISVEDTTVFQSLMANLNDIDAKSESFLTESQKFRSAALNHLKLMMDASKAAAKEDTFDYDAEVEKCLIKC